MISMDTISQDSSEFIAVIIKALARNISKLLSIFQHSDSNNDGHTYFVYAPTKVRNIVNEIIAIKSGKEYSRINLGILNAEEFKRFLAATETSKNSPIFFVESECKNLADIGLALQQSDINNRILT